MDKKSNPYLIAEAGVNYYDSAKELGISPLAAAMLYVEKAKESGCNAIKFQSYKAETLASKNSPAYWDRSKEPTGSQFELFKKFDSFNKDDFIKIANHCREVGIDFMSTPFDFESADYLEPLVSCYKISSSDLSNKPFVEYIARKGKPILLSTGASYLSEVEEDARFIMSCGCPRLVLLHCVLSYPTKYENANLLSIKTLKRVFPQYEIGYSDHTLPDDTMTVLTTAFLLGATVIEKHFTLNKKLPGNDHYHAGDPADFAKAIKNFSLVRSILGSDEKVVFPCEEMSRLQARRSIVAAKDIKAGARILPDMITFKRPGTGIAPAYSEVVCQMTAKIDIKEDTILSWDML